MHTPAEPLGTVPNTPIPEAPPVLRTLLAPPKRRRYSRWRFCKESDLPRDELATACLPSGRLPIRATWFQVCLGQTHPISRTPGASNASAVAETVQV
jgi:hypothetical protein